MTLSGEVTDFCRSFDGSFTLDWLKEGWTLPAWNTYVTVNYSLLKHSVFSTHYTNSNGNCYSLIQKVCRAEISKRPKQVGVPSVGSVGREIFLKTLWAHQWCTVIKKTGSETSDSSEEINSHLWKHSRLQSSERLHTFSPPLNIATENVTFGWSGLHQCWKRKKR